MKCPYVNSTVNCNRRDADDPIYACDSCPVLWGDCWTKEEKE